MFVPPFLCTHLCLNELVFLRNDSPLSILSQITPNRNAEIQIGLNEENGNSSYFQNMKGADVLDMNNNGTYFESSVRANPFVAISDVYDQKNLSTNMDGEQNSFYWLQKVAGH